MINLWIKRFDHATFQMVQQYLKEKKWYYIGNGSFRTVFQRGKIVIKVPHNDEGFEDNITEAYAYRKYRNNPDPDGIIYAPCRLLRSGCLMMPFVKKVGEEAPTWARRLDGWQAGHYKGRIVGYDTGYNIKHENKDAFAWAKVSLA